MEYVLKAESLEKKYRGYTALDGFIMNVPKGSIYGFVGKNGAGKTTIFKMVLGLSEVNSGNVSIAGSGNRRERANRWPRKAPQPYDP